MNIPLLLILEFISFWYLSLSFGFLQTLTWYLAPSLLGLVLLMLFARPAFVRLQQQMLTGHGMDRKNLHILAQLAGMILLLFPMLLTRVLAVLLILPGLRHLLIWKFHYFFIKKITEKFSNGGSGQFRFYARGFGAGENWKSDFKSTEAPVEREVKPFTLPASEEVIDVKPISKSEE